jgi:PilZ domain-containing protein
MPNRPEDGPFSVPAPRKSSAAGTAERRGASRHALVVNAEAEDLAARIKLPARVSDLSVYGCYLDTLNPFPAGTRTRIRLWKGDENFASTAVVVYSHESMGMGVAFTDVEPAAKQILRKWLGEAQGEISSENSSDSRRDTARDAGPQRTKAEHVEKLVQILLNKGLLTVEEAQRILS